MRLDLHALNPPQREAVLHGEGPLLVLAGAGSGKTRVIIHRIARLILDGVSPERILGVTFTNKAAAEMRERLGKLTGRAGRAVHLSTFHALGLTLLKEEHETVGLKAGFCIYDTGDQLGLVRELMRQMKVADRRLDAYRVLELILAAKRARLEELRFDTGDDYELAAFDLYPRYVQQLRAFNAVDFDDLILLASDILAQPEARERWADRFDHILVDEYQDTSPDQLALLKVLAARHGNVCVVGDDDQAIYAWRGAAVDNILSFAREFPGTREVILDQNYRSTGNILHAANSVITCNAKRKEKVLWSAGGAGDPVEVVGCNDPEDEAAFVAGTIGHLFYQGTAGYHDIAVLYRSNLQSQIFEETLALEKIPFRVVGGQSFFDRKEVRDALAFLAVAQNPYDEVSLRRIVNVPPRGIGPTSLERLVQYGESNGKGLWYALQHAASVPDLPAGARVGAQELVSVLAPAAARLRAAKPGELGVHVAELFAGLRLRESIHEADDSPGVLARRLENLDQVTRAIERFERNDPPKGSLLAEFLRSTALARSSDEKEEEVPGGQVTLMTLHGAKGLEFPYVFLVGMEEDLLPHKKTVETGADLGEERRLCYVGMTRARRRLWLTYARTRLRYGRAEPRTPSRFLQEIPDGPHVKRWTRDAPIADEAAEVVADDFFKRMRAQLGIE